MLLSRDKIVEHKKKGNIIIDPFDDRQLKTTSYDVTVGEWYWKERAPEIGSATVHNLYDEASTTRVWDGPYRAEKVKDVRKKLDIPMLKNIPDNAKVILLGPKETILGHTNEFIGGRDVIVTKMYARSSMGRNFIEVCKDAGWGDVGYFNRWTMEITNNSQHYTVPLVIGRRIAQIVFYEVAPMKKAEIDYVGEGGKYQTSSKLAELKKNWKPEMMVPQMHRDWEIKAGK